MEFRNSLRIFCPPINLSYLGSSLIWISILISFTLSTSILAQPTIQWDNTIGGNNWDNLSDLAELPDGSIVFCGITSTSANGDVTQTSRGSSDYWLGKLDANGLLQWNKNFGGSMDEDCQTIDVTSDGGFIIGGWSRSGISGDKTEANPGALWDLNYWVVKTDANGNKEWDKSYGGSHHDQLWKVKQATDGGYILGGISFSDAGEDKTDASQGDYDFWVIKLDASGNKIWDKTYGGSATDMLLNLDQTNDGGYILSGFSNSPANSGNKTALHYGKSDYWVVKIDENGAIEWDESYGGSEDEQCRSVIQTNDGGFLFGGFSNSDANTIKSEDNYGDFDFWAVKTDANGNLNWDKTLGGSDKDDLFSIYETNKGLYLLGGESKSGISGTRTIASKGQSDFYTTVLDHSGNFLYDQAFGGSAEDRLRKFIPSANSGFILGGGSSSNISDDKSEDNQGPAWAFDAWIVKLECILETSLRDTSICLGQSVSLDVTNPYACEYLWDDGTTSPTRTVSPLMTTTYQVSITDFGGCIHPEIVTVTINPVPQASISTDTSICQGATVPLIFHLTGNGPFDVTYNDGIFNNTLYGVNDGHTLSLSPFATSTFSIVSVADNSSCTTLGGNSILVTIILPQINMIPETICEGDSLLLEGAFQKVAGIYRDTLNSFQNCDSIIITDLSVLQNSTTYVPLTSCNPLDTGEISTIYNGFNSCDSIVIEMTTLLTSDTTFIFNQSCNPADTGLVINNLTNFNNYDSIVFTNTTLLASDTTFIFNQSCNPADKGLVINDLKNFNNCDSIIFTNTTFLPSDTTFIFNQSCNPVDTGLVINNLTNFNNCDSIVFETVSLINSDTTYVFSQSCNPIDTGIVISNLTGITNCDSVVFETVSLISSDTTYIFSQSCNPIDTGIVISNLTGITNCDSVVFETISLITGDTTFIFSESCNPIDTGIVISNLTGITNCDSVVFQTVSLINSDTTFIFSESCNPIDTGIVTSNLTGINNCDSIVFETVTLLLSDTTYLFNESCDPDLVGTFISSWNNINGCDSTVIEKVSLLPSSTIYFTEESCSPADTGIVILSLVNQFGCDSTIVTVTNLLPSNITSLVNYSCNQRDIGVDSILLSNIYSCDSLIIIETILSPASVNTVYQLTCDPIELENDTSYYINYLGCDSLFIESTILEELELVMSVDEVTCYNEENGAINIENVNGGNGNYMYSMNNDDFSEVPFFFRLDAGNYQIQVQDSDGCKGVAEVFIEQPEELLVDLGVSKTIQLGETFELQALVNQALDTFYWNSSIDLPCDSCMTNIILPFHTSSHKFTAINTDGCSTSEQITISVRNEKRIYIPSAFSPNGDGANDYFTIFAGLGVANVKQFIVVDRWGELTFEREDFTPNQENIGWTGIFKNQVMPIGVYVYYAEVEFIDGHVEIYKGDVTLIR